VARARQPVAVVQCPQVLALPSGLVEVRVRVQSGWWAQLATQARAEGSTTAELIRQALVSLVPPDGATTAPRVTPTHYPAKNSAGFSVLSPEERRRMNRGERIFTS
jgi:hypothetical protein